RGTLTRLDLAYRAFYRRCRQGQTPGHPRFKSRWRFDSASYPDTSGWRLDTDSRRVALLGVGQVKVKLHRRLPGRPKTATVKREGRRWWLIVVCDQVPAAPLPATGAAVGVDLGVVSTIATSDGTLTANPRPARRAAAGRARAQRDLARKTRGSKRRRKAVEAVAARHRKAARCRSDLAHRLSRQLVDRYDVIVHENLATVNMVRRPAPRPDGHGGYQPNGAAAKAGLNRSIHDAGWGQLLRYLAYKAEEAGRQLIAVDPRNTSRTCAVCGHCEKDNRPSQAVFRCQACGHQAHADINAAINILRAGQAQRQQREAHQKRA
ncbi:MAG: RNA-guided endonuclease InsQ/TnpB family protein, partial [Acidimicrobiales bacterium]